MSNENNKENICQSGYKNHNKEEIFFCNECFKTICLNCLVKHYIENKHKNDECYKQIKEIKNELQNMNEEISQNIFSLNKIIENSKKLLNYYEKIKEKNKETFNKSDKLNVNNIIELKNSIGENKSIDLQLKNVYDSKLELQKFETYLLKKKK